MFYKLHTVYRLLIPSWLVPPALRPDGEQGLGQPLQAQARQGGSHGEPHVTGPGLSRRPGCPENQFSLLQGTIEQTDLMEDERKRESVKEWKLGRNKEGKEQT